MPFATAVRHLGMTQFADTYAGQERPGAARAGAQTGKVTIYATTAGAAGFTAAVKDLATRYPGVQYDISYVRQSSTRMQALTDTITSQLASWQSRGVSIAKWGPDPASGTVTIQLRSYTPAAEHALLTAYGAGSITVSHTPMTQDLRFLDRFYDRAPFYGGDAIFPVFGNPQVYCSDAFAMVGAIHPNNHWLLSAGHCGTQHPWYTNFFSQFELASTGTNYFHGYGGNTPVDVQTIGTVNAGPYVWGNSTTIYAPYGEIVAADGDRLTFDGATTGEVHNVLVTNGTPQCLSIQGNVSCDLIEVQTDSQSSSPVACQGGDSGGPVFQRSPSGRDVLAAGTITAGTRLGNLCYYTDLLYEELISNTNLDTSGA